MERQQGGGRLGTVRAAGALPGPGAHSLYGAGAVTAAGSPGDVPGSGSHLPGGVPALPHTPAEGGAAAAAAGFSGSSLHQRPGGAVL